MIRRELPLRFYFETDARLAALAERWFAGGGRQALRNVVFVLAREGVGTGVIVDGQILHGARAAAGEFGHATLYPEGRPCPCGNVGCWEQYVSERALLALFAALGGGDLPSGAGSPGIAIAHLAWGGDKIALEALRQTAVHVGAGLANVIRAVNPDAIVLGDYMGIAWKLIENVGWEVLRKRVHGHYLAGLSILPSEHAADSSLLGAVALVISRFLTTFEEENAPASANSILMRMS